ncbi:Iron-Responsive Element-Binding Protein 2 [Manis pentadactyla]|nr:Iron-Responsive Element-Binding Protein 2 [Manis pentadactyla]
MIRSLCAGRNAFWGLKSTLSVYSSCPTAVPNLVPTLISLEAFLNLLTFLHFYDPFVTSALENPFCTSSLDASLSISSVGRQLSE